MNSVLQGSFRGWWKLIGLMLILAAVAMPGVALQALADESEADPGSTSREEEARRNQTDDQKSADLEESRRGRRSSGGDPREQAIDTMVEQLESEPENGRLHYQLGNAYQDAGYLHSALQHFNEAIRIDSSMSRAWNNRGSILKDLNRHDEAVESFLEALAIDSLDVKAHVNLGDEYLLQKQYQKAVDRYRRALAIEPQSVNAYYSLAISFAETGMYRDAAGAWRRAAELDVAANGEDSSIAKRAFENAKLMDEIVADAQKQVAERELLRKQLDIRAAEAEARLDGEKAESSKEPHNHQKGEKDDHDDH